MKKISVIGHFGKNKDFHDGQTVKTKIVTDELENIYGEDEVLKIDTYGGTINLLKSPFQVLIAFLKTENILIFPAQNGLRVYGPLLFLCKLVFQKKKTHYIVIGGWLPSFIKNKKILLFCLKRLDIIYVETQTMKKQMDEMGFSNVTILPNCKKLCILKEDELIYQIDMPFKICTFSRVMKEKGIELSINTIKAINEQLGRVVYTLDIYGQIDKGQEEWFFTIMKNAPSYITYKGCVSPEKSVDILKEYFLLLFPTQFYTEGVPGTIIDAYCAGLPVVYSKWESCHDVLDEGITGLGYSFGNDSMFKDRLLQISQLPQSILDLKVNCLCKAETYLKSNVVKNINII